MSDIDSFFEIEKKNKEKQEERDAAQKKLYASFEACLSSRDGRDVIWHILAVCGIFRASIRQNENVYFNEGRRTIGLEILRTLENIDPQIFVKMIAENAKVKQNKGA